MPSSKPVVAFPRIEGMREFTKIYVPIIGTVLLFSGFWYIKAYFSYFSLNELVASLGPDYIVQFSFAVLYELLTFQVFENSLKFFALLIVLCLIAYVLPLVPLPATENLREKIRKIWNVEFVPVFPLIFRIFLSAALSFLVLFRLSDDIGTAHACELLQTSRSVVKPQYFASDGASEWEETLKELQRELDKVSSRECSEPIDTTRLIEIWRTDDTVFLGTQVRSCEARRLVFKVATNHVPIVRHIMEGL